MDISTIKSYEEFDLAFEDYKKEQIFEVAQGKTNEYWGAVEAANSFRAQLSTATEEQIDIITQKIEYWEKVSDMIIKSEPNITDPSRITIILTPEHEQSFLDTKMQLKKALRTKLVDEIQVTVNDKVFDGDETSQIRMTRAIQLLATDEDTVTWVLADNQPVLVTKLELVEALQKAAAAQISLWNIY